MSANDPKRTFDWCAWRPSVAPYVTPDNRLNVLSLIDLSGALPRAAYAAERVHYASRWRGGRVAARGACAARRASSPRRFLGRGKRRRARREGAPSGISGRAPAIGLDFGAQRADRRPL